MMRTALQTLHCLRIQSVVPDVGRKRKVSVHIPSIRIVVNKVRKDTNLKIEQVVIWSHVPELITGNNKVG